MSGLLSRRLRHFYCIGRPDYTTSKINTHNDPSSQEKFETVFSLPLIKYISIINRLKIYHLFGSSIVIPCCGILEKINLIPEHCFLPAMYIGITGAAVLSLASIPFRNVIGFLYISEDNSQIKIAYVDYWGKRKDEIVNSEEWTPLYDMPPNILDGIYLTPKLKNGSQFKLLIRFGKVHNSRKMGEVLD